MRLTSGLQCRFTQQRSAPLAYRLEINYMCTHTHASLLTYTNRRPYCNFLFLCVCVCVCVCVLQQRRISGNTGRNGSVIITGLV